MSAIHRNAASSAAGDLLPASDAELTNAFAVSVHSLVAAIQEALPAGRHGGGHQDHAVVRRQRGEAQDLPGPRQGARRLPGLPRRGHGGRWDRGQATLEAAAVAWRFWSLYAARTAHLVQIE